MSTSSCKFMFLMTSWLLNTDICLLISTYYTSKESLAFNVLNAIIPHPLLLCIVQTVLAYYFRIGQSNFCHSFVKHFSEVLLNWSKTSTTSWMCYYEKLFEFRWNNIFLPDIVWVRFHSFAIWNRFISIRVVSEIGIHY